MLLPMRFFSVARLQAAKRPIEAALAASELPHREQQRLIENVKSGLLFPGVEAFLPWVYPELESVWDYLPRNTLVWLVDPLALEAGLEQGWEPAGRGGSPARPFCRPARTAVCPTRWAARSAGRQPGV